MADIIHSRLFANIKDLLKTGNYSDLTITCGSHTYNVHKAVVCPQVEFFAGAVRFAAGKESQDNRIDLPEDDPADIELLMQFLYECDYEPKILSEEGLVYIETRPIDRPSTHPCGKPYTYEFPHTCAPGCPSPRHLICPHHECATHCNDDCREFVCVPCQSIIADIAGDAHQLLTHAKLYQLADKYDVPGLAALAKEKFLRACSKHWDNDQFPIAARYVFSSTPDENMGFRDIVVKTIAEHMRLLNKLDMKQLMKECNGLAAGILELRAEDLGWLK